jgi:hypothetical protein
MTFRPATLVLFKAPMSLDHLLKTLGIGGSRFSGIGGGGNDGIFGTAAPGRNTKTLLMPRPSPGFLVAA